MNRSTTRIALFFASLLLLTHPAVARPQESPPNPSVDRIFAEWDKPESPGCALGVIENGRFVYQRGYGMANLDYDIPNSPRMVYYIGSESKQFTAAAIGLLALQGKLSLDDEIRKYVPEMPDYGTPITIRHLIHHTSGIRDIYTLMDLAGIRMEDVFPDDEALALIARQKELNFKPGDDYLYSNSGYWLLGQIVERITGKSLREFADESLFRPLGMTRTHFHDDPGHVMKGRAMSYVPDGQGGFRISYLQNFDKIGAGGLYSTMEDLQRWDENFYTHQVGGEALHQLVHTRGTLNSGDTLVYAFALRVGPVYRGLPIIEHGGALMGYRAHVLRFPDQRFTVVTTCNLGTINPGQLARQVAEVYLGERMEKSATQATSTPAVTLTPAELKERTGSFRSTRTGVVWQIRQSGDRLVATNSEISATLDAVTKTRFRSAPGSPSLELSFERASNTAPFRVRLASADGQPEILEPVPPFAPTAAELKAFTGDYYSNELDVAYRVVQTGDRLVLQRRHVADAVLEPVAPDTFRAGTFLLRFDRQGGRPVSFTVEAGRVRNIRFERR